MRALLEWIAEKIADCLPWVIVDEWDWGMVVSGGAIRCVWTSTDGVRGTGFHWRRPFWDDVVCEPRTEQLVDLAICNITTKDGKKVSLSGNMTIVVFDPVLLWRRVHDSEVSIGRKAAGLLAKNASKFKWCELRHEREDAERAIRQQLSKALRRWGVRVPGFELTDFVEAEQHNVFGSLVG